MGNSGFKILFFFKSSIRYGCKIFQLILSHFSQNRVLFGYILGPFGSEITINNVSYNLIDLTASHSETKTLVEEGLEQFACNSYNKT